MSNNNTMFTTIDRQNDGREAKYNCAKQYGGPWWYPRYCGGSDLNGQYYQGGRPPRYPSGIGVKWSSFRSGVFLVDASMDYSLKDTKMMIRRKS